MDIIIRYESYRSGVRMSCKEKCKGCSNEITRSKIRLRKIPDLKFGKIIKLA